MLQRTFSLVAAAVVVTVMAVSANAQPAGTPVLWLDASDASTIEDSAGVNPGVGGFDSTNIQIFRDKSSSGYVLQGGVGTGNKGDDTNPDLNGAGQNGLDTLQFRNLDGLQASGLTGNLPTGSSSRRVFFAGMPVTESGTINGYFNYGGGGGGQWNNMFFYDSAGSGPYKNYMAGRSNDHVSDAQVSKNTPVIVEWEYDGPNNSGQWYVNGVAAGSATAGNGSALSTTGDDVRVGRERNQTGAADFFELIVYDEGTNGSVDRDATGSYLANKWNIATSYVPEPSSFLLLMLGTAALLFRRKTE